MALSIRLGATAAEEATESEFSAMMRRTFLEMAALVGTTITIEGGTEKTCIASPAELSFSREVVGKFSQDKIRAITMLADDFDEVEVVLDQTTCVIDGLTMTINEVDRDPQDPTVRFSVTAKV